MAALRSCAMTSPGRELAEDHIRGQRVVSTLECDLRQPNSAVSGSATERCNSPLPYSSTGRPASRIQSSRFSRAALVEPWTETCCEFGELRRATIVPAGHIAAGRRSATAYPVRSRAAKHLPARAQVGLIRRGAHAFSPLLSMSSIFCRLTDRSRCHCVLAGSAAASLTRMSRLAW
jgi:hypothetical protein